MGFLISTIVVFSLWYCLLRVNVSISFNLDKEVFDDLIWFSAVLFTPYYLVSYGLLRGFLLAVIRSVELIIDLLIFSWFPQKAEQNRAKWSARIKRTSSAIKTNSREFLTVGLKSIRQVRMPFGIGTSRQSEGEAVNDNAS